MGGQLLRKWFFPENFITVVAYHLSPHQAEDDKGVTQTIQLTDIQIYYFGLELH